MHATRLSCQQHWHHVHAIRGVHAVVEPCKRRGLSPVGLQGEMPILPGAVASKICTPCMQVEHRSPTQDEISMVRAVIA
jgi:hypothetical protein